MKKQERTSYDTTAPGVISRVVWQQEEKPSDEEEESRRMTERLATTFPHDHTPPTPETTTEMIYIDR
jgi:hypothetical protein